MQASIQHGALLYAQVMGQALVVYVVCLGLERLWPAERGQPLADWWFNIRKSNTEPLLRLNCEAKTKEGMEKLRDELLGRIRGTAVAH